MDGKIRQSRWQEGVEFKGKNNHWWLQFQNFSIGKIYSYKGEVYDMFLDGWGEGTGRGQMGGWVDGRVLLALVTFPLVH